MTLARTQDEILKRALDIRPDDPFGFRQEVLTGYLDFEHVEAYLLQAGIPPQVTREEWETKTTSGPVEVGASYLTFAFGKARDHRGISASRSVDKLREFAWLAGRDDVVASMDAADYTNYGVPKLLVYAEGVLPADDDGTLARMAKGQPCRADGCDEGCGS